MARDSNLFHLAPKANEASRYDQTRLLVTPAALPDWYDPHTPGLFPTPQASPAVHRVPHPTLAVRSFMLDGWMAEWLADWLTGWCYSVLKTIGRIRLLPCRTVTGWPALRQAAKMPIPLSPG
ncbi:unnamed protein product [Protopolystoma xenopodis]|uniref:Uncharacterized protein n=1 Tax=Protopolystoma xenopodis TaxID=117903 RepID=A0A448X590_9PLAT|nr:unnamed protein product [Protopolystoma xenopodis]